MMVVGFDWVEGISSTLCNDANLYTGFLLQRYELYVINKPRPPVMGGLGFHASGSEAGFQLWNMAPLDPVAENSFHEFFERVVHLGNIVVQFAFFFAMLALHIHLLTASHNDQRAATVFAWYCRLGVSGLAVASPHIILHK